MNTPSLEEAYPRRRNIRLPGYDYTGQGAYFITICTCDHQNLFGHISQDKMCLNPCGESVDSVWKGLPLHYPEVKNDVFIIMPNHVHGIIIIQEARRAGPRPAPTQNHPLAEIVRAFKSYSTRRINEHRHSQGRSVWQRGYYEHVIRSEKELAAIGEYILCNAAKWETDRENPHSLRKAPRPSG
ncbi:MAG: transposase [Dehalococcoidales bacterium]|nr:transposase [Dehalococcoidales bacterium]